MRKNKSGIRLSDIDRIEKSMTIAAANDRDGARRTWAKAICILHDAEFAVIDADSLEEVKAAADKQKAKRPDYEGDGYDDDGNIIYDTWICPNCGKRYEVDYDDYAYCPKCGQEIDWRKDE